LETELAEQHGEVARQREELRKQADEHRQLLAQISQLYASRSWRWTAPLRAASRFMRGRVSGVTSRTGAVIDVIAGQEFPRLQRMGCPFCGRVREPRELPVHFGMKAMVAECSACRIGYQTPRPSVEASLAYMNMRWASSDAYVADRDAQRRRALKCLAYVNRLFDRPGDLLDFGAGIGTFVKVALENGWRATGVEQSVTAIERAKP